MSELILEISAFFISLFCLVDSLKHRRKLYLPMPKGFLEKIRDQHFIYLTLLVTLMLSATASVFEVLCEKYFHLQSVFALSLLNELYFVFHTNLSFMFTLYILNMTGVGKEKEERFFTFFLSPFFLAEILIFTNPFTKIIFYVNEEFKYVRGAGIWVLYGIATIYIILGVIFFFTYKKRLSKMDRSATLILISIAILGIIIQGIWSITVELFFESIGFLGFMLLLEERRVRDRSGRESRINKSFIVVIAMIFVTVVTININLIYHVGTDQTEQIGTIQIDNIKGNLQQTLSDAEGNLLRFSMGMEQLVNDAAGLPEIEEYIRKQKEYIYDLTGGNCYNVYAASSDFTIIPDFDMPEHYHAVERVWYIGAKQNSSEIYISEPYVDAATGDLCFTLSNILSDGDTVTAMDFTLTQVQDVISQMSGDLEQTAMIVTKEGTIVGCAETEHQGEKLKDVYPEYEDIFERVKASQEHGNFTTKVSGTQRIIFSNETSNGWQLILSVDSGTFYEAIYRQMIMLTAIDLLMVAVIIVFYMVSVNNQEKAEKALDNTEKFLSTLPEELNKPLNEIISACDRTLRQDDESPEESLRVIRESGKHLREMMNNLFSYSSILRDKGEEASRKAGTDKRDRSVSSKYIRNGIIGILVAALLTGLILCLGTATKWGTARISREADKYNAELTQWMQQQQSILGMFTDVIVADPSVLNDYDAAVAWLDDIAQNYSDMSACYMANPYAEHPVIMNNGWVPEPDYHVEERQWYLETERSGTGSSISAPYYDARTGLYCITISKIVYSKEGEFLGIFALDCYIDKLIDVLDDSYGNDGYAFLVDQDGTIINHPDKSYEMNGNASKNIEDTEYADAYHKGSVFGMKDYDGKYVSCYVEKSKISGFTVVVVQNWWSVYGTVILIAMGFLLMIVISIVAVAVMISRFISWQEETNEKLVEAAQTAVSAGKAKSRFLAQMSHEIRTPINAVLGMNEMILRESEDGSIQEYAQNIQSASKNLLSLINSILDFSKIEEGKMEIIPVRYDVAAMLGNVIHSIEGRAKDKGLIFEAHIDEKLPAALYGDDVRVSQVVTNLLTNAVKYTQEGRVDLYVSVQKKDDDNVSVAFRVKDTGIGIKKEDQEKLFESFTRLEETRNRNIEGTGLGMAIVTRLLDMMGSKLSMESEYGKGSEFSFVVEQMIVDATPIGDFKSRTKLTERKAEETLYAPKARVLAVDDNEMNLKVIRNLLKLSGIVPDLANSGEEALQKLRGERYDVVLLDHMMPHVDGIETLQMAKEEGLIGATTTVIALTANAVVGARETYLEAGFDDYLSKPVEIKALEHMLRKYLPESLVEYRSKASGQVKPAEHVKAVETDEGILEFAPETDSEEEILEFAPMEEEQSSKKGKDAQNALEQLAGQGLAVEEGIEYCGGEESFYQEMLLEYAESYEEREKELTGALKEKDWKTYSIKVHSLKSTAKTVGDGKVFEMARDLEAAAKAEKAEVIERDHGALVKEYEKKSIMIREILA